MRGVATCPAPAVKDKMQQSLLKSAIKTPLNKIGPNIPDTVYSSAMTNHEDTTFVMVPSKATGM